LASPTARRGVAEGRAPGQRAEPEVRHVVGDVLGEQLARPLQLAAVHEVAVEVDQVGDGGAVGLRHRDGPPVR
jgi:hypothetical protein